MLTIGQAIRNAIEAERAAARFYRSLAEKSDDEEVRAFLRRMAAQEDEHAQGIETLGQAVAGGELPSNAEGEVQLVETLPSWCGVENVELTQALDLAIEAENSAHLFYDALADFLEERGRVFFRELAQVELQHAREIADLRQQTR